MAQIQPVIEIRINAEDLERLEKAQQSDENFRLRNLVSRQEKELREMREKLRMLYEERDLLQEIRAEVARTALEGIRDERKNKPNR